MAGQSPTELRSVFDRCVPEAAQRDLVQRLCHSYLAAHEACLAMVGAEEARDLIPYVRRSLIESGTRKIARRHDLRAESVWNRTQTTRHTRITAGSVIMTVSAVSDPWVVVRDARFRQGYARSCKISLFPDESPPAGEHLYALLTHGGHSAVAIRPVFVQIAFPARDAQCYVDRFSLLDRFPVARASSRAAVEEIQDEAQVALRVLRDEHRGQTS